MEYEHYYKMEVNGVISAGGGSVIPEQAEEITEEEYEALVTEINVRIETVASYAQKVLEGIITMDDVPAEYYDEVYNIVNAPEPEEPEPTYTLDEAAAIIADEVANDE